MDVVENPVDDFFKELCCFIKMLSEYTNFKTDGTNFNAKAQELKEMFEKVGDKKGFLVNSNGKTVLEFFENNYFLESSDPYHRDILMETVSSRKGQNPLYTERQEHSFKIFLLHLISDWHKYTPFIKENYEKYIGFFSLCCGKQLEKEKISKVDRVTEIYSMCFNEINDNFTYNIELSEDFRNINVKPHFNGYFVMLMIELKHDFFTSKNQLQPLDGTSLDSLNSLNLIKIMIKALLINSLSTNYGDNQTQETSKFILSNLFDYLPELTGQKVLLELYKRAHIECVQEVSDGSIKVTYGEPDKMSTVFPKVFSHNKIVVASLDANNRASAEVAGIDKLYKLNKDNFPLLNLDAGNPPALEEETEKGSREVDLIPTFGKNFDNPQKFFTEQMPDPQSYFTNTDYTPKKKNIHIQNLSGTTMFTIMMTPGTTEFQLIFNQDIQGITNSVRIRNFLDKFSQGIEFDSVSIPKVIELYNEVYSAIESIIQPASMKDYFSSTLSSSSEQPGSRKSARTLVSSYNPDEVLYFQNILVGIISLKSMGDLIPYYITLIEALSNYHSYPFSDGEDRLQEVIGYVSSADFSLAQLPLVKLTQNRQSDPSDIFSSSSSSSSSSSDYKFPCSVFAGIHIYNSGYIVPLNPPEKKKLKLWDKICNYPVSRSNFIFSIISQFKANIDIIYSLYYGDINQLNNQLTNIRMLLLAEPVNNESLMMNPDTKSSIDQLVGFYLDRAQQIQSFIQSNRPSGPSEFFINLLCDNLIQLCKRYKYFTQTSENGTNNYHLLLDMVCANLTGSRDESNFDNFEIKKDDVKLYVVADGCSQKQTVVEVSPFSLQLQKPNTSSSLQLGETTNTPPSPTSPRVEKRPLNVTEEPPEGPSNGPPPPKKSLFSWIFGFGKPKKGGNKNTKTYKKKYIKNKINKTYGNKKIKNKMNNTRSNKKLNKKLIKKNTYKKKLI